MVYQKQPFYIITNTMDALHDCATLRGRCQMYSMGRGFERSIQTYGCCNIYQYRYYYYNTNQNFPKIHLYILFPQI